MVLDSLDKLNQAFRIECNATNGLSYCLLSNTYATQFRKGFELRLEAILRSKWSSEKKSEVSVIKYTYEEGPKSKYDTLLPYINF